MDDINDNVDHGDSSGSDEMEQEPVYDSEQQLNPKLNEMVEKTIREQRLVEKRGRQDDEEIVEDDGFVKVIRGHKRLNRKNSTNENIVKEREDISGAEGEICICVTGKDILPKQFGMAKLLRSYNIKDIVKMIYKSAYRVLVYFEKKESALELLNCESFINLGYRVQRTDETNLCYGILRQIDLEVEEKEIMENITSDCELISARRLKRLADNGEWINAETVRICFKGSTLPPYVYGYGCRFKVEPYTFPVSQCSGCWKFGHLSRSCPIKKIVCPKCSNYHANCDTNKYVCVNCKGPHMAMYKKCPVFLKEKDIRNTMTRQNCTYRKALELYIKERKRQENDSKNQDVFESQSDKSNTAGQTYRDIVITEAIIHNNNSTDSTKSGKIEESTSHRLKQKDYSLETRSLENRKSNIQSIDEEIYCAETENNSNDKQNSNVNLDFTSVLLKVKDIIINDTDWKTKFQLLGKLIKEICSHFFFKFLKRDDICSTFISLFNNG